MVAMVRHASHFFAGESFLAITIEEAMKHSPAPYLLQFGSLPPMEIVEHGDKLYAHPTQDPTYPAAELKKARIDATVKAREERNTLMLEALNMLGSLEKLHVTFATSEDSLSVQALEHQKAELLEGLDKAAYILSWSVCNARSRKNANALSNFKRKRSQIKKMRTQLSYNVTQTDMPPQEEGIQYPDPVAEPYTIFPNPLTRQPHQLKNSVRQAIMNEFWTHTLKRVPAFPGCDPSVGNKLSHFNPAVLVSACH